MLKNYFKVALRYLLRSKVNTAINILGLSVGIACCLLIMLFVRSELSYDRFHSKSGRIFRVWQKERVEGKYLINVVTPLPMAETFLHSFPEIESACRVYNFNMLVKAGNEMFNENINMVDSSFLGIFDFKLLSGSRTAPFPSTRAILITPEIATKFFGNTNPLGKRVEMQLGEQNLVFTVSGLIEKSPEESSIKFDILMPFDNAKYLFRERVFHSWTNIFNETYVLLHKEARATDLEKKFPDLIKQQFGKNFKEEAYQAFLQPLTAIHLDNSLPVGNLPISNPKYAYILSTIGVLVLLLACVNFITLAVGRSAGRALEVGIRKVLGAVRKQIIRQFWGEAFLLTLAAIVLGLILAYFMLPSFNQLTEKHLVFRPDWIFFAFCLILISLIALVAGIYPALILSGFNPVEALKGKILVGNRAGLFRLFLLVGQFVIAISMIACALLIERQVKFLNRKDLGYTKDQVIIIPLNKKMEEGFQLSKLFKTELMKYPEVAASTASVFSFEEIPWATIGYVDNLGKYRDFMFNSVDPDFVSAFKIQLVEGRNFAAEITADKYESILVNQALVNEYGWKDPLGKTLPGHYDERIIGVMKDFNYESLHSQVKPLVLALSPDSIFSQSNDISFSNSPQPRVSVRMQAGNISANIQILKKAWVAIAPRQEFEFHFLDNSIAELYKQENRTATMINLASALAIFIACMGLFGLAALTVVQRTREIGIRKIMGSSVEGIVALLSKDFLKPVLIAAGISIPLSWWAMLNWLDNFAYRVPIKGWIFLIAGLTALLIAWITVGFQSFKAASKNPIHSLRIE
jgi:putative ABC transport system permease protein